MSKIIPQHILEAINCGERSAEDYYDIYGKEELTAALEELKKSDEEILAAYPSDIIFDNLNFSQEEEKPAQILKWPTARKTAVWSRVAGIAAAVVVLFVSVTNFKKTNPVAKAPVSDTVVTEAAKAKGEVRQKGVAKGTPQLFVYRQLGSKVELLKERAAAEQGDVLQLAFNANGAGYGLIFSVDGNGNITPHYSNDNLNSVMLNPAAGTVYLDFSYELDDAPDYEVFVVVVSDTSFALDEATVAAGTKSLKAILEGNYLPAGTKFTTFTAKKGKK